ncbi:MAG: nucleotidyltransferase family protein [Clostridia bacterium]|nr:nucleotidyltransferase family protein [Clostridia bacterium]
MNFCGVICEFNPFHNGHNYIINEAKKATGAEIVCLMSGNFVQRGTPAITSKFERAKHAISAGANTVLELPTVFACSNAENFATGAIKIFKALGIKQIAFGIEKASLEILKQIAKLKQENSERFQTAFKNEIQNGINFNTALKRSIASTLKDDSVIEILNKPNNILAIEYLTAILKLDANITPIAIERCDDGFESKTPNKEFLSASAIRELINNGSDYEKYIPNFANLEEIFNNSHLSTFETLALLKIRQTPAKDLEKCYDYTEGIEYRIKEMADKLSSLEDVKQAVATPRYRLPRVNKLLLYPLLNITKQVVKTALESKPAVKVLAINKNNVELLKSYNKRKISLVTTNKEYVSLSNTQKQVIQIDIDATNIYSTISGHKNNEDKKIGTMFL